MSTKLRHSHLVVMQLRVPENLQKRIRPLAKKTQLSDDDIVRLAIEKGLALARFTGGSVGCSRGTHQQRRLR
jgi:hypothetical protein